SRRADRLVLLPDQSPDRTSQKEQERFFYPACTPETGWQAARPARLSDEERYRTLPRDRQETRLTPIKRSGSGRIFLCSGVSSGPGAFRPGVPRSTFRTAVQPFKVR